MRVSTHFSSRHREPNGTASRDIAANPHRAAALLAISFLIVSTSISVSAANGSGHRGRLYVVADDATGANNPKSSPATQNASPADSSVLDTAAREANLLVDYASGVAQPIWDAAMWVSQQTLALLAFSGLDPDAVEHGVLPSTRGNRAAAVMAFGLLGVLLFSASGPLYYSWKFRRVRNIRRHR
jgi:hypothetical protein